MKKWLKEPLVHFILIGAGLFLLFNFTNGPAGDKPNRIVITPGQVEQMTAMFTRSRMRPPTEQEITVLIESYLRDEIYYREAPAGSPRLRACAGHPKQRHPCVIRALS